jgi:hypothetical protein
MKLVITIKRHNEVFIGADCGKRLARILRVLPELFGFEPERAIARPYNAIPKWLHDGNGQMVGQVRAFDTKGDD